MTIIHAWIWILLAALPLTTAIVWQATLPLAKVAEEVMCVIKEGT